MSRRIGARVEDLRTSATQNKLETGLDTEARIRRAATELFYERGYHGTTMREIAAIVGIKAGSLYNHYPSKETLLFMIVYETTKDFLLGALRAIDGLEGPEEKLRALLQWHVTFHAERRLEANVADTELRSLDPAVRSQVVQLRDQYEELMKQVLKQGDQQLGWRIADLTVLTIGIETMCTNVANWFRTDGRLAADKIARIFADFILAGLNG
jgi:AcrR family transcriptional regulator